MTSIKNTNMTLVVGVLIVGLIVGLGVGYFVAPSGNGSLTKRQRKSLEKYPLDGITIFFG